MEDLQRIGCFFLDRDRTFHLGSSTPKVGHLRVPTDFPVDLTQGYPQLYDYRERPKKSLGNVLQFLDSNLDQLQDVDFVTRRGLLSDFMASYLNGRLPDSYWVTKFNGTIYISDQQGYFADQQGHQSNEDREWGYKGMKFESLVFSDVPGQAPNKNAMLSNVSGFYVVFKSTIGGHRVIYNAEVDGVEANSGPHLKDFHLVEAKAQFTRFMSIVRKNKTWAQSYLCGVKTLVIGRATQNKYLQSVEVMPFTNIQPESFRMAVAETTKFLDLLKEKVTKDDPNTVYEVSWYGRNNLEFEELHRCFLKPSFVEKVLKEQEK